MTTYLIVTAPDRSPAGLLFWTGMGFLGEYPNAKLYKRMPKKEATKLVLPGRPTRIYRDFGLDSEALVWDSEKLVAPPSEPEPETKRLAKPVVHLNGSGRNTLMTQYADAYMKLHDAIVALRKLDIHDRDYYPLGPDAGPQARRENDARLDKVASAMAEIEEIYQAVQP